MWHDCINTLPPNPHMPATGIIIDADGKQYRTDKFKIIGFEDETGEIRVYALEKSGDYVVIGDKPGMLATYILQAKPPLTLEWVQ